MRVRWRVERFFSFLLLLTVLFCFFFPCVLGLRCFLLLHYQTEREGHHEVSSLLEHFAGFLSLLVLSSLVQRQTTYYMALATRDAVLFSFRFVSFLPRDRSCGYMAKRLYSVIQPGSGCTVIWLNRFWFWTVPLFAYGILPCEDSGASALSCSLAKCARLSFVLSCVCLCVWCLCVVGERGRFSGN